MEDEMRNLYISFFASLIIVFSLYGTPSIAAQDEADVVESTKKMIPLPPWPKGDQRGMANTLGAGTWARCGYHLANPNAKVYEISHVRSLTMPVSAYRSPMNTVRPRASPVPGTGSTANP